MDLVLLVILIVLIVLVPQTAQIRMSKLSSRELRHIKIKKLGIFFRVGGGRTASHDGITLPMLCIQIQGYVLAIVLGIMGVIWLDFDFARPDVYYLIFIISFFLHIISILLTVMITLSVGHNRRVSRETREYLYSILTDLIKVDRRRKSYDTPDVVMEEWDLSYQSYTVSHLGKNSEKLKAGVLAICENFKDISAAIGKDASAEDMFSHPMWNEQVCIAEDLIRVFDSK